MKRKLILYYYGFQFSFTMLFWIPIFFEYQKRTGMTEEGIFQIQSLYYLAFFIFDIPTGYIADRFGHLKSMKLGSVLLIVANVIPLLQVTYPAWLLHWVMIALARSFFTGASSAYMYELLKQKGLQADYKVIEGKARAYSLLGRVVCFGMIGYLMKWYEPLPYLLTVMTASISLGFATLLPEVKETLKVHGELAEFRLRDGFKLTFQSPWLLFLILQGVVIFVLGRIVIVNLYQPIMESKSFGIETYGLVMGFITLFEAVGSANPVWIKKRWTDLHAVFYLSIFMGVSLAAIPFFGQIGTIFWLTIFSLAGGFCYPIQKQLMNDAISNPRYRATILSIESLIDRAVCAGVAWTLGKISHGQQGFDPFIVVSGVGSVFLMALLYLGMKRLGIFSPVKTSSL